MPLYDGDMVNLLTPDGRAVTMPSGLAANFPGLQPFPIPPPMPAMPAGPASDQAGNPPPAAPPIPAPGPQNGPITDPSQLPQVAGPAAAPQGPVTSPAQDPGVPRRPAPEPSPTKAQLIKEGPAGALAAQSAAIDKQQAAIDRSAQVEADAATQEGHAMAQRDEQTQQILNERAKQAAANEAELNKRIQARDQMADQIAKTRIDRSVDHPIWAQIGLIMSMVGTAMTRRPGEAWNDPAYNTLQQLLDKKVAGQMADLDQKRLAISQMNIGITEQRQHNVDRLTEIDARKDAAIQQAQQAVNTIAMQMKSPAALAKAAEVNATLEEKRADLRGQATQKYQDQMNAEAARAQTLAMHRESLGMQYTIHRETLAAQEREKMASNAVALLKEGKAGAAARAKDASERAIFDPRTGDVQLNPTGQAKLKQADQVEAMARDNPRGAAQAYIKSLRDQATTPEQKQQIDQLDARVRTDPQLANQAAHEYANSLREDARTNDGVLAPDKAVADKIRPRLQAAQEMTDQVSEASKILQAGPSAFDREAWAGLKTTLGDLAKNYASAAGERVTVKGIENAMENIISFDPDSILNREANKGKAIAALTALKRIVAHEADATLKGAGIQSYWHPVAKGEEADALNIDDKTAKETADDRSLGYLNLGRYTGLQDQAKEEAFNDAEARPGSEAGLSPNATTHIKALAARAATAGDAEHDRIVQALANPISDGLKEGARTSVSMGMLEVLRNTAPAVYEDVVAALPASDQKAIRARDALVRKASPVPNEPSGFDPDAAAAADEAERRSAAFARLRVPPTNSPGAGTPR